MGRKTKMQISFQHSSVFAQTGLNWTWWEILMTIFLASLLIYKLHVASIPACFRRSKTVSQATRHHFEADMLSEYTKRKAQEKRASEASFCGARAIGRCFFFFFFFFQRSLLQKNLWYAGQVSSCILLNGF